MKKTILIISVIFLVGITLNSCGGSEEKNATENQTKKGTAIVKKSEKVEREPKPVVSLTKKEALDRMKLFLKDNRKKYSDYGEVQDMSTVGGNYSKDGALDYFYSVNFYEGGDYTYITHFFYDSDQDKISELTINRATDFMKSIDVKEIIEGKLIGSANLWSALSWEHDASRSVNAEFTIDGNKIYFDNKYISKFKKAEKEISNELDQIRLMMEGSGGENCCGDDNSQ